MIKKQPVQSRSYLSSGRETLVRFSLENMDPRKWQWSFSMAKKDLSSSRRKPRCSRSWDTLVIWQVDTLFANLAPDIVSFLRLYVDQQGKKYMLFEYMPRGSLLNFLRQETDKLTPVELITMAIGAAKGMEYLQSQRIIHSLEFLWILGLLLTTLKEI